MLQITVRRSSADLAEGPRQGPLIDPGNATQILHVYKIFGVCARDLFKMIDDLSVPLGSLYRHDERRSRTSSCLNRRFLGERPAIEIDLSQKYCRSFSCLASFKKREW